MVVNFPRNIHHIGNSNCKWNIGDTFSVNDRNQLAHNFRKGVNSGKIEDEILFVGRIIIDEVTLPSIS